jgi:ankyrin repeat protein
MNKFNEGCINIESVIKEMLDLHLFINCKNGRSLLHVAVQSGNVDMVKLLLTQGESANHRDRRKIPPLHISVKIGNVDVTKLLIEHGADVNAADINGTVPLNLANKSGNTELINVLREAGAITSNTNENRPDGKTNMERWQTPQIYENQSVRYDKGVYN